MSGNIHCSAQPMLKRKTYCTGLGYWVLSLQPYNGTVECVTVELSVINLSSSISSIPNLLKGFNE